MSTLLREDLRESDAIRQPILRYLTAWKFFSLVSRKALWFSRLGALEDQFEGRMSPVTKHRLQLEHRQWEAVFPEADHRDQLRAAAERNERDGRDILAVCCWSVGPESPDMWGRYVNSTEGVVIESSPELLCQCIWHHDYDRVGLVRYVDFEKEDLGTYLGSQAEERAFVKRPEFAFERELRVVTMNLVAPSCLNADGTPPTPTQLSGPGMFDPERPGLFVRANIAELVRVVRLAPGATPSFCAQVQRAARDLGLRVEQSGLAR